MKNPVGLKVFVAVVVLAVAIVAGIGFYVSGTPSQVRKEKLDQQRVNQLMQISNAVQNYYMTKSILPTTLDDLKNQQFAYFESLADPLTREPYAYRVASSTAYELCATFQTDDAKTSAGPSRPAYPVPVGFGLENTWQHPAGNKCFTLNMNALPEKTKPPVG